MRPLQLTLAVALCATSTYALSAIDMARTVEGILVGILDKPQDLTKCISTTTNFESTLISAVSDLESLTYEGIRKGLKEAGQVVKLVPTMISDCEAVVKEEISELESMAELFEHPFSLVYHVGKSILVNGGEIYTEISTAVGEYQKSQYFEFGTHLGKAMDIVFLKATATQGEVKRTTKRPSDEKAYDFLRGFFEDIQGVDVDEENLYNNIDGRGCMVWGPVQALLKEFSNSGNKVDKHFWMTLHEVEHIFQEGGESLVTSGVLS